MKQTAGHLQFLANFWRPAWNAFRAVYLSIGSQSQYREDPIRVGSYSSRMQQACWCSFRRHHDHPSAPQIPTPPRPKHRKTSKATALANCSTINWEVSMLLSPGFAVPIPQNLGLPICHVWLSNIIKTSAPPTPGMFSIRLRYLIWYQPLIFTSWYRGEMGWVCFLASTRFAWCAGMWQKQDRANCQLGKACEWSDEDATNMSGETKNRNAHDFIFSPLCTNWSAKFI